MPKWKNAIILYKDIFKNNSSLVNLLIYIIFSAVFFGTLTYRLILVPNGPIHEFDAHVRFAVRMAQEGRIVLPHFLFQLLTILHHSLLAIFNLPTYEITGKNQIITYDWGFAALIVMLEIYVGIALLLFYHLKMRFENNVGNIKNAAYFVAFGISICSPLFLLAPFDGKFYLGYIVPSTIYIIPTQVLLKLPSLALFLLSPIYFDESKTKVKKVLLIAFLVILSGLAKPSYVLIMLPALGIYSLINILKKHYVNCRALAFTLISGCAVLGWQYYFKFIDTTAPIYKSQIIITAPFEAWGHHSDFILIKTILSVLFPIYITVSFWENVKDDFYIKYAWLLFFIGLLYTGFLGESGKALYACNFVWSAQIACFMLFVSAAALFFENFLLKYQNDKKKAIIGFILFCAHVICGLIFYFRSFYSLYI